MFQQSELALRKRKGEQKSKGFRTGFRNRSDVGDPGTDLVQFSEEQAQEVAPFAFEARVCLQLHQSNDLLLTLVSD